MMRCDAEGSRKSRRIKPISEGFLGKSMSKFKSAHLENCLRANGMPQTIDVCGAVEVDAKESTGRESEDEDIVRYLSGHKFRRDRELQLDAVDFEDWKGGIFKALHPRVHLFMKAYLLSA